MKKYIFCLVIGMSFSICLFASWSDKLKPPSSQPDTSYWDHFKFSQIPILHSGRVKPLSTFAREYLLVLHESTSLSNMSAEQWLAETLFEPSSSLNRPLFKIRNPEIIDILDMKKNKKNIYSFNELSKALDQIIDRLNEIKNKPEKERDLLETQLLNLYIKALSYLQLNRSLFMILPLFSMESPSISKELGMNPSEIYSYLEMMKFQQKINRKIRKLNPENFKDLPKEEQHLILLSYRINSLSKNENNHLFRIIPPQWEDNKELWHSPWFVISKGKGSPLSAAYLESWVNMEKAYRTGKGWKAAGKAAYQEAIKISKNFSNPVLLYMEKIFNDIQFFQKSLVLYILAFLCFLLSFIFLRNLFYKLSFISLAAGFFLHLTGVIFRICIMGRPPVSTLYESVLFVGLVSVGLSVLLEKHNFFYKSTASQKPMRNQKEGMGLLIGSLTGIILHFIAFKYKGAESMSLLVPVLNTNFWLATHVTCITIGYGCAIVASLMGHIYILAKCFHYWPFFYNETQISNNTDLAKKEGCHQDFSIGEFYLSDKLDSLYKNMSSASFFALFFCLFGTMLGGIWADQSWGRFWGWDPKENGALAIIIWLLVLIHGRLAGLLKDKGYALGMVFTNVVVALSWFGVNLLNVGLHSYGFIEGILWGLIVFCGGELLFILSAYIYLKRKNSSSLLTHGDNKQRQ